jgi:hypothetical protein
MTVRERRSESMAQAISDVMTPDSVCVDPHDSAADAVRSMRGAPANQ